MGTYPQFDRVQDEHGRHTLKEHAECGAVQPLKPALARTELLLLNWASGENEQDNLVTVSKSLLMSGYGRRAP